MNQIHRRFSDAHVRSLLRGYREGLLGRPPRGEITAALSPQAKGKIERSYRWLQNRIVRTCALEKLSSIEEVRRVLQQEIHRYNHLQVHPTTGEIPDYRFAKARKTGRNLFRPFVLPKPYRSTKDVFCLKETRVVNPYRRLALYQEEIPLRHVPPGEEVDVHLIPNIGRETVELRVWWKITNVQSAVYPFKAFPHVHF